MTVTAVVLVLQWNHPDSLIWCCEMYASFPVENAELRT
jgi:hypothetical protein